MKRLFVILATTALALPCLAQQSSTGQKSSSQQLASQQSRVQQQGSPAQPVRIEMVCRDMASTGNYLEPNETMLGNKACHPVDVQRLGNGATAANTPVVSSDPASTTAPEAATILNVSPTPHDVYATHMMPPATPVDNSVRVYVTDIAAWTARGGWSGKTPAPATPPASEATQPAPNDKEAAAVAAEVDKLVMNVNQHCPQVLVTSVVDRAAFAVTLDHQKKGKLSQENKIVVFNHDGDDIFSADTKGLSDSLENACKAILKSAGR
jgi:hypothetical protein